MPRLYETGVGGSVLIGANTLCVEEWTITLDAPKLDVTNTCSVISGIAYQEFINAPIAISGSVKAFFDCNSSPFGAPISLTLGSIVTLTLNVGLSGKAWILPSRIDKINMQNNAKNPITFDFDFSFSPVNGSITYPS